MNGGVSGVTSSRGEYKLDFDGGNSAGIIVNEFNCTLVASGNFHPLFPFALIISFAIRDYRIPIVRLGNELLLNQ